MKLFGLVDCNNFYVSCERVFQPSLANKPVLVLSNNDGCVIARSNEVKQLGIAMGAPYFKIKKFCEQEGVRVFSSNYALYADLSARVMSIIQRSEPCIEIYSIDEAFFSLESLFPQALEDYFIALRAQVLTSTGIPISIGMSTTKTLSKIANHVAKKQSATGVCILTDENAINLTLRNFPVSDVWGVGRRLSAKLLALNIETAFALKYSDECQLRNQFSVVLARTIEELRGVPCQSLAVGAPKKTIVCSRSFGERVRDLSALESAITLYATQACEKLRAQGSTSACIHVFLEACPFSKDKAWSAGKTYPLSQATSDTRSIITVAKSAVQALYRAGVAYKKAGVVLMDIADNSVAQGDLFLVDKQEKLSELMQAIDSINAKWGRSTLYFAAQGECRGANWQMKSELKSQSFTSSWGDLLEVN